MDKTNIGLSFYFCLFVVAHFSESISGVLPVYAGDLHRQTENQKTERKLPTLLKALSSATTFDDSTSGESEVSTNFKNYVAASDQIQALETSDLQYLLNHASPAGRLYAAVLLKQSGRVGDNESFAKLSNDNASVVYRGGCIGMPYKVKDIANCFIKDGYFKSFKFSQYCKLKTPVTASDASIILDTAVVEHFQQGDSNQPSRAWLAFQDLLKAGNAAKPQINQLVKAKAPGSKLYGAILLQQIDLPGATSLLKSWQNDNSRVLLSKGCAKEETTLGDLAKRLLKGEQIVMLKNPN